MIQEIFEKLEWEKVMKTSEKSPIIVYFYANWCVPSLRLKQEIVDIGSKHPSVDTFLVDIEKLRDLDEITTNFSRVPITIWVMKRKIVGKVNGNNIQNIQLFYE